MTPTSMAMLTRCGVFCRRASLNPVNLEALSVSACPSITRLHLMAPRLQALNLKCARV